MTHSLPSLSPHVLLPCLLLLAAISPAHAVSERETLVGRCWIGGIPAASPIETKPQKSSHNAAIAKFANVASPQRSLAAFTPIQAEMRGAIRRVDLPPGSKKLIALTFDLCEQPNEIAGYDGPVVDYLRDHNIKATFFAGGKWLLTHRERAEQMLATAPFEFGNHSWTHRNTRIISAKALSEEIEKPQAAYEETREHLASRQCMIGQEPAMSKVPKRMGLFRFPFGSCTAEGLNAVADNGLLAIQWDVSSGDPSPGVTAAAMTQTVMAHVKPGSIVIFHANGRGHHTAEALPLLIPKLKAQGYEFVTVNDLLKAGKPMITTTCYDAKPGDTDKYDYLFSERGKGASPKDAVIPAGQSRPSLEKSTVPR